MADRSTARQTGQDGVWVTGDPPARDGLDARLRRDPSPFSVTGSLPVLFFGDLFAAQVATVGLNPSDREYVDARGRELDGPRRRFETLGSLRAIDRASLSTAQCDRAIQTMRSYFQPGKPIYGWFRSLDRLMRAMGFEYGNGEVVHLDLVQEATRPTWLARPTGLGREGEKELGEVLAGELGRLALL